MTYLLPKLYNHVYLSYGLHWHSFKTNLKVYKPLLGILVVFVLIYANIQTVSDRTTIDSQAHKIAKLEQEVQQMQNTLNACLNAQAVLWYNPKGTNHMAHIQCKPPETFIFKDS